MVAASKKHPIGASRESWLIGDYSDDDGDEVDKNDDEDVQADEGNTRRPSRAVSTSAAEARKKGIRPPTATRASSRLKAASNQVATAKTPSYIIVEIDDGDDSDVNEVMEDLNRK